MKPTLATKPGRAPRSATLAVTLAAALFTMFAASSAFAQAAEPAPAVTPIPDAALTPEELEKLVARIALYPDDLVALILPASTNPLQIVQADRYLAKRKTDPKLPLDDKWDDSVKSLLNYPEVVTMMSNDLDWTAALGEAVVADQGEVLEAVQAFRRKTQSAGNLKTDPKQTVVVEKEVIKIVPTDPQVIYVPQYNPTTVVVSGGYYGWGYYPTPYPVYYYPYAAGRRVRDRADLGRGDRRGVERRPLGRQLRRRQQQHQRQPQHQHQHRRHRQRQPAEQPARRRPGQQLLAVEVQQATRTGEPVRRRHADDRTGDRAAASVAQRWHVGRGGGGRGGSAGRSAGTSDGGGGGGGRGGGAAPARRTAAVAGRWCRRPAPARRTVAAAPAVVAVAHSTATAARAARRTWTARAARRAAARWVRLRACPAAAVVAAVAAAAAVVAAAAAVDVARGWR